MKLWEELRKQMQRRVQKAAKGCNIWQVQKNGQAIAKAQQQATIEHCEECAQVHTEAQANNWTGLAVRSLA